MKEEKNFFCSHQLFQDFDQWAEAFKIYNLSSNQLSKGKFKGELAIAGFRGLQITYASVNQAMHIMGSKPANSLTFGIPLTSEDEILIAHDNCLSHNILFGLNPHREIFVVTRKACEVAIISVNVDVFYEYANLMKISRFNDKFFQKNTVIININKLNNFKSYLKQLFYLLIYDSNWLSKYSSQRLIIEDFLPLFIDILRNDDEIFFSKIMSFRRYEIIRKMDNFIMNNIDQPLTLKDLYTALKTSSRALSYATQDIFAMSPMEYLKVKRLHGVRLALKASNPNNTKVFAVANNWGFWSMGHFSRDYKQLFGESPSEILRNH
ncbi:helix-turn-helix domain-containing protein [Geminocystis sp. NIES-3709]|uniref:helix-turn-helix domain-containing protein n=1 Tax=Geminocystis sp. NIES-3709 TaxID=1617448 RepID=UPI0005FC6E13|nr:helix-turn-helix domain-containing protein [Geminocystis sp. NIES-3709]BAQ64123.1 transcriptional regulator [Geminocystis sp. NIES-3709]